MIICYNQNNAEVSDRKKMNTVEPLLWGHPFCIRKVAFQEGRPLVRGRNQYIYVVRWHFQRGWPLKRGSTVNEEGELTVQRSCSRQTRPEVWRGRWTWYRGRSCAAGCTPRGAGPAEPPCMAAFRWRVSPYLQRPWSAAGRQQSSSELWSSH